MNERRRASGFTLLEVLIAVTILGIVLTTIYGAISRTITSKEHAESAAMIASAGREALFSIADEIEASLSPDRVPGAGFRGASGGSGEFLDQVLFAISSRPPFGPISSQRGGRVLVHYYCAEQEGAPRTYLLVRSEQPIAQPTDPNGGTGVPAEEEPQPLLTLIADNVAGLRLRYLDGNTGEWSENWDSEEQGDQYKRLPVAVDLALYLYDEAGMVHDFSAAIDLPLATRPTPTAGPGQPAAGDQ